MVTAILILIAAIVLVAALAAMFRDKKRGAFDVNTRNPNEFASPVTPGKDTNVTKNEYELNDKAEEGTKASQPASPNVYNSPVAPTQTDNTRVHKNEFDLNDKGEEGTRASQPASRTEFDSPTSPNDKNDLHRNEFDLNDKGSDKTEPKNPTEEPPK